MRTYQETSHTVTSFPASPHQIPWSGSAITTCRLPHLNGLIKKRGIALLSLEEKIDTSSAAGELVFHVFGAIAQFEHRLIAERTRDGMNAARAKGSKPG